MGRRSHLESFVRNCLSSFSDYKHSSSSPLHFIQDMYSWGHLTNLILNKPFSDNVTSKNGIYWKYAQFEMFSYFYSHMPLCNEWIASALNLVFLRIFLTEVFLGHTWISGYYMHIFTGLSFFKKRKSSAIHRRGTQANWFILLYRY